MMIRPNPNQPCKGNLVFSSSIRFVSIFVVIPQVYTDKIICRTKLIKGLEKDLNPMDKLPRIQPEDELSWIIGCLSDPLAPDREKPVYMFVLNP